MIANDNITPGQRIAAQVFGIAGNTLLNRQEVADLIDQEFKSAFQEELVTGHASSPYHLIRSMREVRQFFEFSSNQGGESDATPLGEVSLHRATCKVIVDAMDAAMKRITIEISKGAA